MSLRHCTFTIRKLNSALRRIDEGTTVHEGLCHAIIEDLLHLDLARHRARFPDINLDLLDQISRTPNWAMRERFARTLVRGLSEYEAEHAVGQLRRLLSHMKTERTSGLDSAH